MDFQISDEQHSARELAAQILRDFTGAEQLQKIEAQETRFDPALWQALADAGLLGLDIAEAQGGMDLGYFSLTLLCEEMGRSVAPLPLVPVLVGAAGTLRRFAGASQQERWLPGIASGALQVSAALEEYGNDDPATPAATATRVAGGYAISGSKMAVSQATVAERILLSAKGDGELLVALLDPRSSGVSLNPQRVTSGETLHELVMAQVQVAEEDIVARGAEAEAAMHWALQASRTAMAACALGLCDSMMRLTAGYTSEREQFGRPIATFQAVSHRVADCYIDIECLRLVTQQAASLIDRGRPATEAATVAKIWCGDVCHRVSQAAQHCHGGTGVDRDYALFRYCLMARQLELSLGNSARLNALLGAAIAREYLAAAPFPEGAGTAQQTPDAPRQSPAGV